MNSYRDTILLAYAYVAGLGSSGQVLNERSFTRLRESIADVTRTLRWPRPGRRRRQRRLERQLKRSPTRKIHRVLRGSFFQNLDAVRSKMTNNSWIEIQGCRVGRDQDYLTKIQEFFTRSSSPDRISEFDRNRQNQNVSPRVTAPRWYQFFGNFGFTQVRDSQRHLRRLWGRQQVREAFEYWYPIITGQEAPFAPTLDDFRSYLRTPHALPLGVPGRARSQRQNLEILFMAGRGEAAFLDWLAKHSYRLTAVNEIRDALFTSRRLGTNIGRAYVDWLQERSRGRTRMLFRPDPDYSRHIEEAN